MLSFLVINGLGIATGVVLKTLVPMPFLDTPVKRAWLWLLGQTLGRLVPGPQ
jgi:hypothetical protein